MAASQQAPASGRITRGIAPNTLVDETMKFVENQLRLWRDDKTRPAADAEEQLNSQLCKFLGDRARSEFPMAAFHHEEHQGKRRRVDISAVPTSRVISATTYFESIYEPFLVIEGKRLPAPSKSREREYVTGFDERSGGIQRFRLCLHGAFHAVAAMIGYVQDGEVAVWRHKINGWIAALNGSPEDTTCEWSDSDQLCDLVDDGHAKAARCESSHARIGGAESMRLVHLWICMPKRGRGSLRKRKAS